MPDRWIPRHFHDFFPILRRSRPGAVLQQRANKCNSSMGCSRTRRVVCDAKERNGNSWLFGVGHRAYGCCQAMHCCTWKPFLASRWHGDADPTVSLSQNGLSQNGWGTYMSIHTYIHTYAYTAASQLKIQTHYAPHGQRLYSPCQALEIQIVG